MALGASRTRILREVLMQSLLSCGVGLLIGIPLAYFAGRLLSDRLFGVGSFDLTVVTIAVLLLSLSAAAAALLPARRQRPSNLCTTLRPDRSRGNEWNSATIFATRGVNCDAVPALPLRRRADARAGIGATTHDVLRSGPGLRWRPLPFDHPSQLVVITEAAYEKDAERSGGGISLPDAEDWQTRSHTLQAVAYYTFNNAIVGGIANPQSEPQLPTSANFLNAPGRAAGAGCGFAANENNGAAAMSPS